MRLPIRPCQLQPVQIPERVVQGSIQCIAQDIEHSHPCVSLVVSFNQIPGRNRRARESDHVIHRNVVGLPAFSIPPVLFVVADNNTAKLDQSYAMAKKLREAGAELLSPEEHLRDEAWEE